MSTGKQAVESSPKAPLVPKRSPSFGLAIAHLISAAGTVVLQSAFDQHGEMSPNIYVCMHWGRCPCSICYGIIGPSQNHLQFRIVSHHSRKPQIGFTKKTTHISYIRWNCLSLPMFPMHLRLPLQTNPLLKYLTHPSSFKFEWIDEVRAAGVDSWIGGSPETHLSSSLELLDPYSLRSVQQDHELFEHKATDSRHSRDSRTRLHREMFHLQAPHPHPILQPPLLRNRPPLHNVGLNVICSPLI